MAVPEDPGINMDSGGFRSIMDSAFLQGNVDNQGGFFEIRDLLCSFRGDADNTVTRKGIAFLQ